ncbi:hypothetical protein ACFLST_00335 [Chloroflexota bacterium]
MMGDVLDEASALVECKECPWYKSCVLPVKLSLEDMRRQLESTMPGTEFRSTEQYGIQQLLGGLAAAAQNSLLEGCPIFINRLRQSPELMETIKRMMRSWGKQSE